MNNICVFCGSNSGGKEFYKDSAVKLGEVLAEKNINLVYGGGNIGLMGAIADTMINNGGKVIGVIPEFLADKELAHNKLTELHIVKSMHERKEVMAKLADAFIALPGGFGTFEEILEAITWTQLGLHNKPCGFLNVEGFYDMLLDFFNHAKNEKFIRVENSNIVLHDSDPEILVNNIINYKVPYFPKWVDLHI